MTTPSRASVALDSPRAAWAYESIVDAVPGVRVSPRLAVAGHFLGFEALVVVGAWLHGLWLVVPAATLVVAVAAAGSAFTFDVAAHVRDRDPPAWYVHLLFGSNVEFLFAVTAYAILLTDVIVRDPGLLRGFTGGYALPTFVALVVLWDVCYRIAVAWWAAVLSLYRSLRLPARTREFRAVDLRVVGFAVVQLALVPVLLAAGQRALALLVAGHVVAVFVVVGAAVTVGEN